MPNELKDFAQRVCDWKMGPRNRKIEGTFHAGDYRFKPFKITGERARKLIDILIRMDDAS